MNVIERYRQAEKLRSEGLSEVRIGIRMGGLSHCVVSRLLELGNLDPDVARLFDGENLASLSALRCIAKHPKYAQGIALAGLRCLVRAAAGKMIQKRDVLAVVGLRGRWLDGEPFPTKSCRMCDKRTGQLPDLFGELEPGNLGRCTDAGCYARTLNAVKARRARWGFGTKKGRNKK